MYANVILNQKAYELDRTFCYEIPPELVPFAERGKRVSVPFRFRGTTEGIIIGISDEAPDIKKIKKITKILDEEPSVNELGFKIAGFIHRRYLASHYEALKLVMPSGLKAVMSERLSVNSEAVFSELSGISKEIVEAIQKNGSIEETALFEILSKKSGAKKALSELKENKIILSEVFETSSLSDKFLKIVSLIDVESAKAYAEKNSHKKAQLRIIKILINNKSMELSDLLTISGASKKSVDLLVKCGIAEFDEIEAFRNPYLENDYPKEEKKEPTEEQEYAIDTVLNSEKNYFLIRGVTGSGKTEIYLQVIEKIMSEGKNAIVLVPEIALTAQMVDRFYKRFQNGVAVLHSGMTLNERYDQYKLIKKGEIRVVIGARSAIFAPVENVGIIIVDEEHEQSYKSDGYPRYDAIEVAHFRAKTEKAKLVLASATPSIVSYYRALNGVYELIELNNRVNNINLPEVEIVDMRDELKAGNFSPLSRTLQKHLKENLKNKTQSILFLNRRGYSTFVSCRSCGYVAKCPECEVSLTYHSYKNKLICHYCGHEEEYKTVCPVCESKYLKHFGTGTQKMEEEIKKYIPELSVIRMDADTTMKKFAHDKILRKFENEKTDVLLGTQMVSKGLDFENVSLSAVLAADGGLFLDDYRSSERTFSQITQVCGRAGRGKISGRSVVQTYNPEHYTIQYAKEHNYIDFYKTEIKFRKQLNFPPFCDIINVVVSGEDDNEAKNAVNYIYSLFSEHKKNQNITDDYLTVFKPSYAPLMRIKGKYRHRILVKCKTGYDVSLILSEIYRKTHEKFKTKNITVVIDINPTSML